MSLILWITVACLALLSCCIFLTVKNSNMMVLMNDTFDKIENKTPTEAIPIIRQAYPGKIIRLFRHDELLDKRYWREDAVHIFVDTDGKIIAFSKPGGDGIGKPTQIIPGL